MKDSANPVVTVGIPCRNAGQWIAGAIESALNGQGVPVEVIVVDDGSTDNSLEIIRSFGESIRFFDSPGNGAPAARNKVLEEACGEWIQYLDADDYLLPGKISTQISEAAGHPPHTVPYAPVISETWRNGGAISRATSSINTDLSIETQWILWQLPQTSGVLWPASILRSLGGWKEGQPCCQEHELYLRALLAGIQFCHTPSALAVYRLWSEETLCRRDPALVIRERTRLIEVLLNTLEKSQRISQEHRDAAAQSFFEMSRSLAKQDPADARAYHAGWKSRGLMLAQGPAAPFHYRLIYNLCGFAVAERIARILR